MGRFVRSKKLEGLRAEIVALERAHRLPGGVAPFGIAAMDAVLPAGG